MSLEFVSLKLRNTMSIGNIPLTFYFSKGITTWIGKNGAGKSLIPDMMHYALTGKAFSSKNVKDLINWDNRKNFEVEFTVVKDEKKIEIIRHMKPDHQYLIIDDVKQDFTGKGGLNEKVVDLLRFDKKLLGHMIFLANTGLYKPFLKLSKSDRRDVNKRLFSLDVFDRMKEIESKHKNVILGDITVKETEITGFENTLNILLENKAHLVDKAKKEIKEQEFKLTESIQSKTYWQNMLNDVGTDNEDCECKLSTYTDLNNAMTLGNNDLLHEISSLEKEQKQNEENECKIIEINRTINQIKKDIAEQTLRLTDSKFDLLKSTNQETFRLKQEKHEGIVRALSAKKLLYEANTKDLERIESENKELTEKKKDLENKLQQKTNELSIISTSFSSLDDINELTNELNKRKGIKQIMTAQIVEIKKTLEFYNTNNVCPTCETVLTTEKKKEKTEELTLELNERSNNINNTIPIMTELSTKINLANESNEQAAKIKNEISLIDYSLHSTCDILNKNNNIISNFSIEKFTNEDKTLLSQTQNKIIETKEALIEFNSLLSEYNQIKSYLSNTSVGSYIKHKESLIVTSGIGFEEQIAELNAMIESHKELIKSNTEEIEKVHELIETIKKTEAEIKTADNYIKWLEETIQKLKHDIDNFNMNQIDEQRAIISKSKIEFTYLKYDLDVLNKILGLLGDAGIKRFIISKYRPLLNDIAQKFVEKLNSKFGVSFTEDGMDCEITDRGRKRNYGSLSNGQQKRIDNIIIISFLFFQRIKSNNVFPFISFDEILDGSLDKEGIDDLVEAMSEIRDKIPYVNVITHKTDSIDWADRVIEAKLKGRFTEYTERGGILK